VAVGPADKEAEIKTRWFATTMPALCDLHAWLREEGCTTVARESTGSWWISKTDFRNAVDPAVHHPHGLLTGSFLPERGIVELRDLTGRRKKLLGNLGSEKNRIQNELDTAGVKMGNVVRDVRRIRSADSAVAAQQRGPQRRTDGRSGEKAAAQPHPGAYRGFTGSPHERSSPLAHPAERRACAVSGSARRKRGEEDRPANGTVLKALRTAADDTGY
jgi:hypothetical protein